MYGPATSIFLREAVKDTNIDNIPIFKGVGLKMELLPNHYNEKYFKNPLKFDPLRWQEIDEVAPFSYGGFGFGARTCLGKHLAYLSTKIIIIMLMKRYKSISIDKKSDIRF
jgi:cytochrome P450